jgi:hypothetical protein
MLIRKRRRAEECGGGKEGRAISRATTAAARRSQAAAAALSRTTCEENGKPGATCIFPHWPAPLTCAQIHEFHISDATSAKKNKRHPVAFWTCGARLDRFKDPKNAFLELGGPI